MTVNLRDDVPMKTPRSASEAAVCFIRFRSNFISEFTLETARFVRP
jgi:hypothetical protein